MTPESQRINLVIIGLNILTQRIIESLPDPHPDLMGIEISRFALVHKWHPHIYCYCIVTFIMQHTPFGTYCWSFHNSNMPVFHIIPNNIHS